MKLTRHFTLEELTFSMTAIRRGVDNTLYRVDPKYHNLVRLANTLELVRALLSRLSDKEQPITINSGYRSPALNSMIGGSRTSAHMKALAADIVVPKFGTPEDVSRAIADSDIEFDQLIFEGAWTHIGLSEKPRKQVLTAKFPGPKYFPGIVT